jgi:hypothetical protein
MRITRKNTTSIPAICAAGMKTGIYMYECKGFNITDADGIESKR